MLLHVVDNSLCVFVCHHIPCLSVENVSVTTMVSSTPTTQPNTSHPTTPTLLTRSFAPDPQGNAHMAYLAAFTTYQPFFLSFTAPLWCLLLPYAQILHTHTHTLTTNDVLRLLGYSTLLHALPFFTFYLHEWINLC